MAGILDYLSLGDSSGPGLLGNIFNQDNRNAMMMLGLGLASGNSWGEGAGNAIKGYATGQQQDQQQAGLRAAIPHILSRPDIDPGVKAAIARNPSLAAAYITELAKPPQYKFESSGQYGGRFNSQTGQWDPQVIPKVESVPEGGSLAVVTPPALGGGAPRPQSPPMLPNAAPANDPTMSISPRQVAQANAPEQPPQQSMPGVQIIHQGQRKAPEGYTWVDPRDPTKGVTAIPGGAATHVPAEIAGRLAMMDVADRDLTRAREVLLRDRTGVGYGVGASGIGSRVQSTFNMGEIGRAQRTVQVGVEAALRVMTGAAAPPAEVKQYVDLFAPTQNDNAATVRQKLDNLKSFMDNARSNAMQGRGGRLENPNSAKPNQDRVPPMANPADPLGLFSR